MSHQLVLECCPAIPPAQPTALVDKQYDRYGTSQDDSFKIHEQEQQEQQQQQQQDSEQVNSDHRSNIMGAAGGAAGARGAVVSAAAVPVRQELVKADELASDARAHTDMNS